jgi:hypothetical protein
LEGGLGTLGTDGTAVSIVAFIFYVLSPLSLPLTDTLFIFSCSIRSKKKKYIRMRGMRGTDGEKDPFQDLFQAFQDPFQAPTTAAGGPDTPDLCECRSTPGWA